MLLYILQTCVDVVVKNTGGGRSVRKDFFFKSEKKILTYSIMQFYLFLKDYYFVYWDEKETFIRKKGDEVLIIYRNMEFHSYFT